MKVTVGIPIHNNAATIGRVLDAVLTQTRPPDEVIVVDDGSRDGSGAEAHARGVRIITHNRNLGLAQARNTIIQNASGEIIVYFDADAIPRSGCLEKLLGHFHDKTVGAVGGRGEESGLCNNAQKWRARHTPQDHGESFVPNDWMLMGLCCAFRGKALAAVDGFDASFALAGEDVDICLRLRKAGWRLIYEPAAVVEHIPGGDAVDVTLQAFKHAAYATFALGKNNESSLGYIYDTYRHLTHVTLEDLKSGRFKDSALGVLNLWARTVGILTGTVKAKASKVLKRRS